MANSVLAKHNLSSKQAIKLLSEETIKDCEKYVHSVLDCAVLSRIKSKGTLSKERLAKLMNKGDVIGIEKAFNYAADWDTREWLVIALHTMVFRKLNFDKKTMNDVLYGIVQICKAEVGGGSYRINCLSYANDAIKELHITAD